MCTVSNARDVSLDYRFAYVMVVLHLTCCVQEDVQAPIPSRALSKAPSEANRVDVLLERGLK